MKVLLSWPYAQGEYNDPPDSMVALIPTRALFRRAIDLMRKAEKLERQIDGFIRMDVQDWSPLFIGAGELNVDLEPGQFHEIGLDMSEKELSALAESSTDERVESCVAFVEKERIGWEFYAKYWDVPCYTGALERKFVEEKLKETAIIAAGYGP